MSGELVQEYGDSIDGAACLEVRLDLLGRSAIVHIADEDTSRIDVFSVLAHVLALVQGRLHLAQLRCFSLHLGDPPLHC